MPCISVIVPVYKVEKYLRRCVDSILSQSFTDFELLLTDDGSPDNCPAICDNYAAKDSRVRVIHKENGGLSSARNAALNICEGKYICFVDSDDYISPDMFEKLLSAAKNNDCEVAICGQFTERDGQISIDEPKVEQLLIFDSDKAIEKLIEDKIINNYVWDKIYKKYLFDGVRFPDGRN